MKKVLSFLMVVMICLSMFIPASLAEEDGAIAIAFPSDPGDLSPWGTVNSQTDCIINNIYESFSRYFIADQEWRNLLMESVEVDETGMIYTVKMVEGAKDTNGNEIKASDALYSFQRCSESSASASTKQIDFANCEVLDDYTLKIAMTEPGQPYWNMVRSIRIVSQASMEASEDGMVVNPVGTGSYKKTDWVSGAYITLEYDDTYRGEAPQVKSATYKIISESTQRTTALLTGEVDYLYNYLTTDYDYLANASGVVVAEEASPATVGYFMNCDVSSACNNADLRRAICLATSNEAVCSVVYTGHAIPAAACVSNSLPDYDVSWEACEYYQYNIELAKEYLEKSGYDTSKPIRIITKAATANMDNVCTVVQNMLKQIGLESTITQYENAAMNDVQFNMMDSYDLAVIDWYNATGGVYLAYALICNRNYVHVSGELQETLLGLGTKALSAIDDASRIELSKAFIDCIQDECVLYGIVHDSFKYAHTDKITNFETYGNMGVPLQYIQFVQP